MNNSNIIHSFSSGEDSKPTDAEMFFMTTFATASNIYGLLDHFQDGKPPFSSYMTEFLTKIVTQLDTPYTLAMPAHFIAWHYMQKYDGNMPDIDGFVGLVQEYLGSDFKPWAIIKPNPKGVLFYEYAKKTGIYSQAELALEKIYSAGFFLDACFYACESEHDNYRYANMLAAAEGIVQERNFLFLELLKTSLDTPENSKNLAKGQKKRIISICKTVLENYEVAEDVVPELFSIATTISYVWIKGRPTHLEDVLDHMQMYADDAIVDFLNAVSKSRRTAKAREITDLAIEKATRSRNALIDMANDAIAAIIKNGPVKNAPGIAKAQQNTAQQAQQIKIK